MPGRHVHVLEEEDRAVEIDLPGRSRVSRRSQRQPPTSGGVACGRASRADVQVVGPRGTSPSASVAQRPQETLACPVPLLRRRPRHRAVERDETRALADRDVQRRDVGIADERLRVRGDHVEVEEGTPAPPVAAAQHWTTSTSGSAKRAVRSSARCSGGPATKSSRPRLPARASRGTLRFPPLDSAEKVGTVLAWARGAATPMVPPSGSGEALVNLRHHVLDVGVVLQRVHREVLAVAGLLVAPVRHLADQRDVVV